MRRDKSPIVAALVVVAGLVVAVAGVGVTYEPALGPVMIVVGVAAVALAAWFVDVGRRR